MAFDLAQLAAELLRVFRGRRSQRAFSKRLGYRSNIAYRWETGRCFPSASEGLAVAARSGVDVAGALRSFLRSEPAWLTERSALGPQGIAALLRDLRGKAPLVELAARSEFSRFSLSRWLKGSAEPRFHELLALIELLSYRVLDFVAELADPAKLPCISSRWAQLEAARDAAYAEPWSHAILRGLELTEYRKLRQHRSGWLAERLGIPLADELRCVQSLEKSGQIRRRRRLWEVTDVSVVDTRRDRSRGRTLKAWWFHTALERFDQGAEGVFGYNLMAVSAADLPRLRELHVEYFQAMRALVAASEPSQHIVLFCTQLVPLDAGRDTA